MRVRTTGAIHSDGPEQRTYFGRFCRYFLGPLYYWLDLLDDKRRPSHSKVTWTVAFGFGLGTLVFMIRAIFVDHDTPTNAELGIILAYSALVFALAGGLNGYKSWLNAKGGGTVDAFAESLRGDATGTAKAWADGIPPATGA